MLYFFRSQNNGVWLSLVKRSSGGREIAGSNPVTPIKKKKVPVTR